MATKATKKPAAKPATKPANKACLLYTSDAADERSSVDLGGRRIIKKKKTQHKHDRGLHNKNTRDKNKIKIKKTKHI